MKWKKYAVRSKKEAEEICATLHLYERRIDWTEVPGVWVVKEPESRDEIGEILAIVTFQDFYGVEVFHEAAQVLEILNGDFWQENIPFDAYPTVERALRKANHLLEKCGDYGVDMESQVRQAEKKYNDMVDYRTIQNLKEDDRVTVATKMARFQCSEYEDAILEAKRMRDQAQNITRALSKTIDTFRTISAKLRKEYEKWTELNVREQEEQKSKQNQN